MRVEGIQKIIEALGDGKVTELSIKAVGADGKAIKITITEDEPQK